MDWITQKIEETEYWLDLNQRQGCLHAMTMEDELLKQAIRHKKETLELLKKFLHHPLRKSHDYKETF